MLLPKKLALMLGEYWIGKESCIASTKIIWIWKFYVLVTKIQQIETSGTGWVTLGREAASQWLTPLGLETDSSRRRRPLKVLLRFKIFPQFICLVLHGKHFKGITSFTSLYVLNWIFFQTLRDQIKYINVFVIAFKQTDTRMTYALRSMISLFEKMFGDGFWNNAILEVQCQTIFLKRADI